MNNHRVLWLIIGIALIFAGIFVLGYHAVAGVILFLAGIVILIFQSISVMRVSGGVKENYFYRGGKASERFVPDHMTEDESVNVWDRLTERKEKAE